MSLFSKTYSCPFGIAPMGFAGLLHPEGDLCLAKAAAAVSGTSVASMEEAARIASDHIWYQLYAARRADISADLIRRAQAVQALVTIDPAG